jgi:hypothetical protein
MPWEQQPAYQRIERHPKRVSRNCRKHESESAGRGYLDFHLVLLAITCVMRMLRQSDRLALALRRESAGLLRGHKLVSHTKQVSQDIRCDTGQANQHRTVANIVISHVVNIGSGCEQFGAVVEADANRK